MDRNIYSIILYNWLVCFEDIGLMWKGIKCWDVSFSESWVVIQGIVENRGYSRIIGVLGGLTLN